MANIDLLINIRNAGIDQLRTLQRELNNLSSVNPDIQVNTTLNTEQIRNELNQVNREIGQVLSGQGAEGSPALDALLQQAEQLKETLDEISNAQVGGGTSNIPPAAEAAAFADATERAAAASQTLNEPTGDAGIIARLQQLAATDLSSLVTQLQQTQQAINLAQSGQGIPNAPLAQLQQDAVQLRNDINAVVTAQESLAEVSQQDLTLGSLAQESAAVADALNRARDTTIVQDIQGLAQTDLAALVLQLQQTNEALALAGEGTQVGDSNFDQLELDASRLRDQINNVVSAREDLSRVSQVDTGLDRLGVDAERLQRALSTPAEATGVIQRIQGLAQTDLSSLVAQLNQTQAAIEATAAGGGIQGVSLDSLEADAVALRENIDEVVRAQESLISLSQQELSFGSLVQDSQAIADALNRARQTTIVQDLSQLANTDLSNLVTQLQQTNAALELSGQGVQVGDSTFDELTLDAERLRGQIEAVIAAQQDLGNIQVDSTALEGLGVDAERLQQALDSQGTTNLVSELQTLAAVDLGELTTQLDATTEAIASFDTNPIEGRSLQGLQDEATAVREEIDRVVLAQQELFRLTGDASVLTPLSGQVEEVTQSLEVRNTSLVQSLESLANVDLSRLSGQLAATQEAISQTQAGTFTGNSTLDELEADAIRLRREIEQAATAQRQLAQLTSTDAGAAPVDLSSLGLSDGALSQIQESAISTQNLTDRFAELSQAAVILDGPLGGIGGRLRAISVAFRNFNPLAIAAAVSLAALTAGFFTALRIASRFEEQFTRLQRVVNATGAASGQTATQIDELSRSIARNTLASVQGVRDAATALLTFRSISGEVFQRTLTVAQDLSAVLGTDLRGGAVQLGRALEDPVNGLNSLRRSGVSFTQQQRDQIRVLTETGNLFQAQSLILAEIEQQVGGAADANGTFAGSVDSLGQSWEEFLENLARRVPVLEIAGAAIDQLTARIDVLANALGFSDQFAVIRELQNELSEAESSARNSDGTEEQLQADRQRVAILRQLVDLNEEYEEDFGSILDNQNELLAIEERRRTQLRDIAETTDGFGTGEDTRILDDEAFDTFIAGLNGAEEEFGNFLQRTRINITNELEGVFQARLESAREAASDAVSQEQILQDQLTEIEISAVRERISQIRGLTASEENRLTGISSDPDLSQEEIAAARARIEALADLNESEVQRIEDIRSRIDSGDPDQLTDTQARAQIQAIALEAENRIETTRRTREEIEQIEFESQQRIAAAVSDATARSEETRLQILEAAGRSTADIINARIAEAARSSQAAIDAQQRELDRLTADLSAQSNFLEDISNTTGLSPEDLQTQEAEFRSLILSVAEATQALVDLQAQGDQELQILRSDQVQDTLETATAIRELSLRVAELRGDTETAIGIQTVLDLESLEQELTRLGAEDSDLALQLRASIAADSTFQSTLNEINTLRQQLAVGLITDVEFQSNANEVLAEVQRLAGESGNLEQLQDALDLSDTLVDQANAVRNLRAELAQLTGDEANALNIQAEIDRIQLDRDIRDAGLDGSGDAARLRVALETSQEFEAQLLRIQNFQRDLELGRVSRVDFESNIGELTDELTEIAERSGNVENIDQALSIRASTRASIQQVNSALSDLNAELAELRGDPDIALRIRLDADFEALRNELQNEVDLGRITPDQRDERLAAQSAQNDLDVINERINDINRRFEEGIITIAQFQAELSGTDESGRTLQQQAVELARATGNALNLQASLNLDDEIILTQLRETIRRIQDRLDSGEISAFQAEVEVRAARETAREQATEADAEGSTFAAINTAGEDLTTFTNIAIDAQTQFADGFGSAFQSFITGSASASEAFSQFAASFLANIATMIAQALVLQAIESAFNVGGTGSSDIPAAVNHAGGIVGRAGRTRIVNPALFFNAPRFHGGGIPGLASDEVPSILQRGEEVLARDDPRNVLNGGGSGGGGVQVNTFLDMESLASSVLESTQFDRAVAIAIQANRESIGAVSY